MLLLFTAGCAVAVWLQTRRTARTKRELDEVTAELEDAARRVFEAMPEDEPEN